MNKCVIIINSLKYFLFIILSFIYFINFIIAKTNILTHLFTFFNLFTINQFLLYFNLYNLIYLNLIFLYKYKHQLNFKHQIKSAHYLYLSLYHYLLLFRFSFFYIKIFKAYFILIQNIYNL